MTTMARKIRRSNPKFFRTIGARGGNSTFEQYGSQHFRLAALASHAKRRERRVAELKAAGKPCPKCDRKRFPVKAARLRNNKVVCSFCGMVPR